MFTTPNTISVPPEYEIETDVPSVAEFVTCSLDGRIWIYRRSRRYYVAVFRWDEETQRLVFVSTTVLNGETVIKRGVDWILTDKSLIRSLDNEPYISRTEYESEDTTYIDRIKSDYSFFSELKTWIDIKYPFQFHFEQIPKNIYGQDVFYVPDINGTNIGDISSVKTYRMDIYYDNNGDIKIDNDFHIVYLNGQLYAKGKNYIGKAYFFPKEYAGNNMTGGIQDSYNEFYLLIVPEYGKNNEKSNNFLCEDTDDWEKLFLAPVNESSIGCFIFVNDSLRLCNKIKNNHLLTLPQYEQFDFNGNNGTFFFDISTGTSFVLNDKGVLFLNNNLNYECMNLRQWVTPTGDIDVISPQMIGTSFNNKSLFCFPEQEFYRLLFNSKDIILPPDKQFALAVQNKETKKVINVYSHNRDIHYWTPYSHSTITTPHGKFQQNIRPYNMIYNNVVKSFLTFERIEQSNELSFIPYDYEANNCYGFRLTGNNTEYKLKDELTGIYCPFWAWEIFSDLGFITLTQRRLDKPIKIIQLPNGRQYATETLHALTGSYGSEKYNIFKSKLTPEFQSIISYFLE